MVDCLFCRIVAGNIPVYKVCENNHFLALLDIHPHAPGHTVVIPKQHLENFSDLPTELSADWLAIIQQAQSKLGRLLGTSDFTIGINDGLAAGRAIDHLHCHLLPRFKSDGGGSIHSIIKNPSAETVAELAARLHELE